MPKQEIILGIDPGFGRMGFGAIEKMKTGEWRSLDYGCIDTSPKKKFVERLQEVYEAVEFIIKKYKPSVVGVEKLYFARNVTTAIEVAQARGVILLCAVQAGLQVDEYTPQQIKQAITGYGKAEKQQMQKMVAMILGIKGKIKSDDAADALAVALCTGQSLWVKKVK
ncbi:MAG: crossover junction endodeoxyribonuclease RuvC [Candidatus Magasanikbacteria bacterium]